MKRITTAIAVLALTLPAMAQMPGMGTTTKDPVALAQCLIENSGETEKQGMRDFMIAALQKQKEAANQAMMSMGMNIAMKATQTCGWTLQDMQTPQFEQAASQYGEYLGMQIMEEAMGEIGMQ